MHIETNIKIPDLGNNICMILRYDRKSGKFTYYVNFVLFPGNFSYLCDSRMEYFPIGKFCLGNFEKRIYVHICIHTHTLIHRDCSPCAHS